MVVLRGAGPAFVAGGDVASFKENLADFSQQIIPLAGDLHGGILALRRARKPVIASVHGAVAGAGMSIMMACDLIIAAEGTQFNMAYSRIATSPDGGATWFLPRLVGYHKAMEMFLLAEAVDAPALQAIGHRQPRGAGSRTGKRNPQARATLWRRGRLPLLRKPRPW